MDRRTVPNTLLRHSGWGFIVGKALEFRRLRNEAALGVQRNGSDFFVSSYPGWVTASVSVFYRWDKQAPSPTGR
jgi:hypothetical protein